MRHRYAPIDWIYSRPHGKLVAAAAREIKEQDFLLGQCPAIKEFQPYITSPSDTPPVAALRYSVAQLGNVAKPRSHVDFRWEVMEFAAIMDWCIHGKQVCRFDEEMTDYLRSTEMSDIKPSDLMSKNEAYYIVHDGPEYKLPNGQILDGIIVSNKMMSDGNDTNGAIQNAITEIIRSNANPADFFEMATAMVCTNPILTISLQPRGYALWPEHWVHGYAYELDLSQAEGDVYTALVRDISRNSIKPEFAQNAHVLPFNGLADILKLTIASYHYIKQNGVSASQEWQAEAPAQTVKDANDGRKKAVQDLVRQGYIMNSVVRMS